MATVVTAGQPVIVGLGSKTTITHDRTDHLAGVGRTIASATTPTATAGTISGKTNTTTGVTFLFDATALVTTQTVIITVTATYDNGDVDPRYINVQVAATP